MKFVAMPRYLMRKHALYKLLKSEVCAEKKLLEIGYGSGDIFDLYNKLNLHVEGYDFSEAAYEYAQTHLTNNEVVLLKNKSDIGEEYDYVVACEVLEHIADDMAALKEWKSYLNDTGKMIISVPAHWKRWGSSDEYVGHYRRYEKRELIEKFKNIGMRVEKIYTYDFPACLFLDGMRDNSRKKKLNIKKSKEELSKNSGIERNFSALVLKLSNPILWKPIIVFEELFYKTDLGSAYILLISTKR